MNAKKTDPVNWRSATKLVRGGTARSPFGETSEGLFLAVETQNSAPSNRARRSWNMVTVGLA